MRAAVLEPQGLGRIDQTIFVDDPEGRSGNCLQAALASLFGLDLNDVPHFVQLSDDGLGEWTELLSMWLDARGWRWESKPNSAIVPPKPCLLIGTSPRSRNESHAVMWTGSENFDPHPSRDGLYSLRCVMTFTPVSEVTPVFTPVNAGTQETP